MAYTTDEEIDRVVDDFESCQTGKDEFHHQQHIVVAVCYLASAPIEVATASSSWLTPSKKRLCAPRLSSGGAGGRSGRSAARSGSRRAASLSQCAGTLASQAMPCGCRSAARSTTINGL